MTDQFATSETPFGILAFDTAVIYASEAVRDPWVATLAHELRNPLGAVLLALDELNAVCAAEPAARAARDMAEHGSRHMASVIRDVLDLCRSARGCLPAHLERVDLPLVVAGAVAATRPLMAARHHRFTVSIPQRLPTLIAQSSRIEQILTNLIDNAAKFTEAGGHVTLTVEPVADAIELRVRDDGTGIAREMLPHVFDSRRRNAASRHRPGAGLGIGLPLVKTLVHLLQGTVTAHSDGPGTGSEFVVRLPTSSPLAPADGRSPTLESGVPAQVQ